MKLAFFAVLWLVSLVRFSAAQCALDVTLNGTSNSLRTTLLAEVIGGEFNDNRFDGEEALTYLCYTRDATDNSTFTGVRISAIYGYESSSRALRATLYCRGSAWSYNSMTNSASEISLSDHVSTSTTVEGCRNCLDTSTESFNDPSWCNLTSPCDTMPAPCNTGTCSRTGLTELMCTCPVGYTGSLCETGNPCTTGANPCMNGGLCSTPSNFGSFSCDCSQTVWSGPTCNVCPLNCQNGGTLNSSSCSCSCVDIFSGDQCETCDRVCQNGGTLNSALCTCSCSDNYAGDVCETCTRVCQNGGTLNSALCTCSCSDNYAGDVCETCTRVCQHGGTLNSALCTCSCSDNYAGDVCETCSLQCQNGGTLDEDKCSCSCASGYSGTECGMMTDVGTSTPASGLDAGGIAGIIVATIILLLIIITATIVILVVFMRRKDKK